MLCIFCFDIFNCLADVVAKWPHHQASPTHSLGEHFRLQQSFKMCN